MVYSRLEYKFAFPFKLCQFHDINRFVGKPRKYFRANVPGEISLLPCSRNVFSSYRTESYEFFMYLQLLLRKKAAEELKKEQERKAAERRRIIEERCGKPKIVDEANEGTLLRYSILRKIAFTISFDRVLFFFDRIYFLQNSRCPKYIKP